MVCDIRSVDVWKPVSSVVRCKMQSDIPIRMISYGGSKYNVSVLIDSKNKEKALLALNKGLFDL